jgi:hypothetical protein
MIESDDLYLQKKATIQTNQIHILVIFGTTGFSELKMDIESIHVYPYNTPSYSITVFVKIDTREVSGVH